MKKIIIYLGIILLAFAACDPMEDIYKELDEESAGYTNSTELILSSDDYATISELAYDRASTPLDSSMAAFIEAYEHFNDSIKAADYVPAFLAQMYPALSFGSDALVTYNYNGEMPEDLAKYTDALSYELYDEDYSSFDSVLNIMKFYTPSYLPEIYLPGVLNEVVAAPEDGDLILVSYKYADADPAIDFKQIGEAPVYIESFTNEADGMGSFTAHNVLGDQDWSWASYGNGCAVMTGYVSSEGNSYDNENWLVSPQYDLSDFDTVSLTFQHAVNYNDDAWDFVTVHISTDYDGTSNPSTQGTWTELTIPGVPFTESWNFVSSGRINLKDYAGQQVYIGFKYLSTTVTAGTWEIGEVAINIPGVPITGKAPEEYKNYYSYSADDGWLKEKDIYYVNAVDYDAMGAPGKYNNFSASDKPIDYLPNLLQSKYPLAGQDYEVVTVYKYFNSANYASSMLVDRYTYNNGEWESSYNFVQPKTDQFLVATDGNWVFDPTITISMASDDYQIVVDWVKEEKGDSYIDDYSTAEFYTGAAAYYANYDIREGSYESADFGSWQSAVAFSIGNVFLPAKFPEAVEKVDGIDMYYIVNFDTYSGADGNVSMKFQVTKAGPDPEFTFVEIVE